MENRQELSDKKIKKSVLSFVSLAGIIGIICGGILGYIYYIKVGCTSGTCAITSNPVMSIIWGSAIGYLLGDMFKKK